MSEIDLELFHVVHCLKQSADQGLDFLVEFFDLDGQECVLNVFTVFEV